MRLSEYTQTLQHSLKLCTVTFLIRGDTVCLGLKKRGFGKGYYLGIGGKVEEEDRAHVDEDELLTIKMLQREKYLKRLTLRCYPKT